MSLLNDRQQPARDKRISTTARQALVLTALIWLVTSYGAYAVSELIAGRTGFVRDLPLDLPAVLAVALLAFGLYPVAVAQEARSPVRRWAAMLAAAVAIAFAQSIVNMLENWMLGVIPALEAAHLPLIRQRFGRNFLSHLYMCIATGALFIFLIETRRTELQRLQRLRAERIAADARMAALSLQMNPHFLFNALNSVSSLIILGETAAADAMVGRLADFLRRSLSADPTVPIPLSEEMGAVASYMEIEETRFEERLIFTLDLPDDLAQQEVLPFLLQPLAENAVKYGVARSRRPVEVRVSAHREDGVLILRVEDDAATQESASPGPGIGIAIGNVRERLAVHYGPQASVTAHATESGFVSEIRIPLR
ncbi:sensor histidine kinase [Sphingomonas quercus]|uniref:Histidine kinase n=1 Tax=Sphingomonas quercus TaxID=2842451 RepID=A0ABS6BGC5_9SPHN|nr:histidine kinase [Sphingomonas quercus]MBU3077345.1 histidine kinase [Sphingomonas quercus]